VRENGAEVDERSGRGPGRTWARRRFPLVTNYRGKPVRASLGISMAALMALGGLGLAVASVLRGDLAPWRGQALWMIAGILTVFLAGLYDDYRPSRTRGLVRQIRMFLDGQLTSGIVKLIAIAMAAGFVSWGLGARGSRFLLAVPTVAAAANLWNLLDVVPGRALKFFIPATLVLVVVDATASFTVVAAASLAAGAVAIRIDLRERGMLGDAGSNVLGFIVGIGLLRVLTAGGLAVALGLLVALHAVAETVTLSRVIALTPPLRWFDRLGRVRLPGRSERPDPEEPPHE
jgi:UDP-GlcNAc:undecaprenyl-phosphate/decaprenyl-phosphate GlcNAc-1-phosphate transferase